MKYFIMLFLSLSLFGESFAEFKKSLNSDYHQFRRDLDRGFKKYKTIREREFRKFKKEIYKNWGDYKTSSKKVWVEYSKNLKERKIVDFKKNEVRVEIISKGKSRKEVEKELYKLAVKTLVETTDQAQKNNILENRVEKKLLSSGLPVVKAKVDRKPILQNGVFEKRPTIKEVVKYVKKSKERVELKKGNIYSLKIKLPKYFPLRKAKGYRDEVAKQAKRFNIDKALVFAIMHSESGFNPLSTSHIPAYGLMQIVPRSAGIDAYHFVYNRKKILSSSYLYNSRNNIELGTAYLHILSYKYLKGIKNPESRRYCVISAYNTGAGNVARVFVKTRKGRIRKAVKIINQMTPQEVYNSLIQKLPYDETKVYLKRVSKRYNIYKKLDL